MSFIKVLIERFASKIHVVNQISVLNMSSVLYGDIVYKICTLLTIKFISLCMALGDIINIPSSLTIIFEMTTMISFDKPPHTFENKWVENLFTLSLKTHNMFDVW